MFLDRLTSAVHGIASRMPADEALKSIISQLQRVQTLSSSNPRHPDDQIPPHLDAFVSTDVEQIRMAVSLTRSLSSLLCPLVWSILRCSSMVTIESWSK